MLDVHLVCRAYMRTLQPLNFRVWFIFKPHYILTSHSYSTPSMKSTPKQTLSDRENFGALGMIRSVIEEEESGVESLEFENHFGQV